MILTRLFLTLVVFVQTDGNATKWQPFTSQEGKFVVDFPGKPSATVRQMRSRSGLVKIFVVRSDTPDVDYIVQKIELPQAANLKAADIEAVLDFWRDDISSDLNGKVIASKKLRLGADAPGRDFIIEGRPDTKQGIATIRVREFLSQKVLYILLAVTAADKELPDDVGHFFASFSPGTKRLKKMGPHPEPEGTPVGSWGEAIDPDHDCQIEDKSGSLEITVPNTLHDLNADNDKLNAPRVLREVTGDFSLTVAVAGDYKPTEKSTNPKAVPYIGGGIVVWQDSNNYIFLGRAAMNRRGKINEMAAFEEREWGSRGAVNNAKLEPGPTFLRLERRGNRIMAYTSKDGKSWTKLEPMEPTYPTTLKVGLYAINGTTEPTKVVFSNFNFTAGKPDSKAKSAK
jgi:regulation of enolase protein 1 (concanavalin A-like superfamily)